MRRIAFLERVDRKWWLLALALAAGGAAAWFSQRHLQSRVDAIEYEARSARTSVVVAAVDLRPGQRITADLAAIRDIPDDWLPSGTIDPVRFQDVEGSVVAHPVRAGEPVLFLHLEGDRPVPFAERLAEGRRAVTIPVDEISSVSGLLQPGDRIDLYVSLDHRGKRVTMPLLQKMRVLATGRQTDVPGLEGEAARGGFSTVTLDATPEEAVRLIAARDGGVTTAMLRRPGDGSPAASRPAEDLPALLGLREEAAVVPVRAQAKVAVIYGDRAPARIPRLGEEAEDEPFAEHGGPMHGHGGPGPLPGWTGYVGASAPRKSP